MKSSRQKLQEYEEKYSEIPLDLEERLEYMVKKYNVSDSKMEKILMKKQLMLETLIFKHIRLVLMEVPEGTPRHRYRIVNKSNYHQMAKAMPQYVHVYSPGAKENNVRMKRLVGEELDELQALITTPCIITYRTFHKTPDTMPIEDKFLAEIGLELPMVKPDWDNLGKKYSDMSNMTIWLDDSFVCRGTVEKYQSILPRVEIDIYYLNMLYNKYQYNQISKRKDFIENNCSVEYFTMEGK